ncbi:MAG: hypothetical protein MR731_00330 [Clostridiales bacterium]|nr:hypothetical protein [Clostridiales bacterium]
MSRRRFKRAKRRRRKRSLSASVWGPILKLLAVILVFLALLYAIFYIAIPKAADLLGWDYRPPFAPEPTPAPTPVPTPTPNPMSLYDFTGNSQELVFDGSSGYKWFTDPYFYSDKMVISAGKLDSSGKNVVFRDMFFFHPNTRISEKINLTPQNDHFLFPKFNDKWLVYLDGSLTGGGAIMAADLTSSPLRAVKVKDIYSGQPEPFLSGNYVAFTDRTGTNKDKLFVYDLTTMESTVVAMFSSSVYGQSKPFMSNDTLIWADSATSDGNSDTSVIRYINLNESSIKSIKPGTFVHDPEYNGRYIAWLTELHGRDTALYAADGLSGTPTEVDRCVVEFGLGSHFIAYSRTNADTDSSSILVFSFADGKIYRVTQEYESALLLGVSDDYVVWMDVTSRERDIVKFTKIP